MDVSPFRSTKEKGCQVSGLGDKMYNCCGFLYPEEGYHDWCLNYDNCKQMLFGFPPEYKVAKSLKDRYSEAVKSENYSVEITPEQIEIIKRLAVESAKAWNDFYQARDIGQKKHKDYLAALKTSNVCNNNTGEWIDK